MYTDVGWGRYGKGDKTEDQNHPHYYQLGSLNGDMTAILGYWKGLIRDNSKSGKYGEVENVYREGNQLRRVIRRILVLLI